MLQKKIFLSFSLSFKFFFAHPSNDQQKFIILFIITINIRHITISDVLNLCHVLFCGTGNW
jgi:hypothetical protein